MTGPAMRALPLVAAAALLAAAQIPATRVAHAEGDAARGEKLYADCVVCHSVERGVHGIGPSLYDIIGRKAGEVAGYRYSRALRNSGLTWTAESLDTFIGDPQASVPANRMPYAGMTDARDRADLIAYLRKLSK
jgi:cytochrome c